MLSFSCRRIFTAFLVMLLTACLVPAAHAYPANNSQPRSIRVSGIGKVSVAPDKADLTLSVEVQAKSAEAARNQAAAAMAAVIKTVKNIDIADKDIQTRSVSLYPTYAPDTANKIVGYQLINQMAICIREVNKASEIIDSAVKAGGNSVRVQGINFAVDNPDPALTKAREKAYADAKFKAEQYAKLAGLTLGAPLHISEGGNLPPVPVAYAEMSAMKATAADSPTPIQIGEQEVSVSVEIMFGIQ